MMQLVTAGTGTAAPHPRRVSPAHWVERGSVRLLMDCGAGALHRLAQFGAEWPAVTHLALTHFHLDHVGEVPALLFALKYTVLPKRITPLTVFGPMGTSGLLRRLDIAHGGFAEALGFPLVVQEITPSVRVALGEGIELTCHSTPHTAESLAFSVTAPEGRLVYTGDTGPSPELAAWARGCDLLLAECSLPDAMAIPQHLTPRQAGALAEGAEAKRLVLTHLYPPVEAVPVAAQAAESYGGSVVIAEDGARFELA